MRLDPTGMVLLSRGVKLPRMLPNRRGRRLLAVEAMGIINRRLFCLLASDCAGSCGPTGCKSYCGLLLELTPIESFDHYCHGHPGLLSRLLPGRLSNDLHSYIETFYIASEQ